MGTKLNRIPNNETELNELIKEIYKVAKNNHDNGKTNSFTGILEIVASEPNIVTAIHKIKSNKGSKTSGVDNKNINDYLKQDYDVLVKEIQQELYNYKAKDVKRVWISKPGKSVKRPLGIPTIKDRIIQECIRNILEPIAEAQFFKHSYGFRPMRSAEMAIARISAINWTAKCYWVVEGDIKGFFDNINHNVMIKSLWNIGIRDKRILCIITEMLKAGVMNECTTNDLGTPQGGIISPLLANIYLNRFDNFITGDFEQKKLRRKHTRDDSRINAMRNFSNIKTAYYVRYADDWVILTDNKRDAEKLKYKAKRYLNDTLKLELSEEKTKITDIRKKPLVFLGVEIKVYKNGNHWVNRISSERERFKLKMKSLRKELFYIRKINTANVDRLIENINRVNSIMVGIINYYKMCDQISVKVRKYAWTLKYTAYKSLKRYGGTWVKAKDVSNLIGLHSGRNTHIPAIKYKGMYIGLTSMEFASWEKAKIKDPKENPYTDEGLKRYFKRTNNRPLKDRVDEVNSNQHAQFIRMKKHRLYNFEYFMNRPYAYNRDRGKCKICNGYLLPHEVVIHHINPKLPIEQVNKVKNLLSVHEYCHQLIHGKVIATSLDKMTIKRLTKYQNKLI